MDKPLESAGLNTVLPNNARRCAIPMVGPEKSAAEHCFLLPHPARVGPTQFASLSRQGHDLRPPFRGHRERNCSCESSSGGTVSVTAMALSALCWPHGRPKRSAGERRQALALEPDLVAQRSVGFCERRLRSPTKLIQNGRLLRFWDKRKSFYPLQRVRVVMALLRHV